MENEYYYGVMIPLAIASMQLEKRGVSLKILNKSLEIIDDVAWKLSDPYQAKLHEDEFKQLKAKLLRYKARNKL